VTHGGLIRDASTLAAAEKPDAVTGISSIENARRTAAFVAQEHKIAPAEMRFPPVADNRLWRSLPNEFFGVGA
jgi:hypothetical protein